MRSLQQRCDLLQAQLVLAETAVRDAAQRQAATRSLYEAAQADIHSLNAALAEQSRESAMKCAAAQEQERSAASDARNLQSVISCASSTLGQLASLQPRHLHTKQVRALVAAAQARD
jgi:hypothetical protein